MSAKPKRKQKPEDMLLRIIHVAEILAKGETEHPNYPKNTEESHVQTIEFQSNRVQKTQM